MSRKVCKKCRLFVTGTKCPICKGNQFSKSWQGRLTIINPTKSNIAQRINIEHPGDYTIKVK